MQPQLPQEIQSLECRLLLTDYIVTSLSDVPETGAVATDGQISLREAIRAANTNTQVGDAPAGQGGGAFDTISFDFNLPVPTLLLTNGVLSITDNLTFFGNGATELILDAQGSSRIFDISGPISVFINGMTLTRGANTGLGSGGGAIRNQGAFVSLDRVALISNSSAGEFKFGGAVSNENGSVSITNSLVINNSADFGGGIYNQNGFVGISNSTISGNKALSMNDGGGGIYNDGGFVGINNSAIASNTANNHGGGIYNNLFGQIDVRNSFLSENSATGFGGGIYNQDSFVAMDSSSLFQNSASLGGFAYNLNGEFTISNSALSENTAALGGVGYNEGGTLRFNNAQLFSNSAFSQGGGIYVDSGTAIVSQTTASGNTATFGGVIYNAGGSANVTQSTFSNNFAGVSGGAINNNLGTLAVTNSTISGNSANEEGGGIFNQDALLVTNSTLVANLANADNDSSGDGGGIFTSFFSSIMATQLFNTIVAGNFAGTNNSDLAGDDVTGTSAFNLIGDPNSTGGLSGNNSNILGDGMGMVLPLNQILDPTLQFNGGPTPTHQLIFTGRALDAGNNDLAVDPAGPDGILGTNDDFAPLAVDQRGFPRIIDFPLIANRTTNGGVDIGAVEFSADEFSIFPLNADLSEGDMGNTMFTFQVIRSGSLSGPASVDFFVTGSNPFVNGTDFAGGILPFGTVNFDDGDSIQIVTIDVQGDLVVERDEVFFIDLTNPSTGTSINISTAQGTIRNDDTALVSIDDVTDFEDTGNFTFLVSLSNSISEDVTIQVDTLGITATSGVDFTPIFSQVLTFTAGGPLTLPVTVTVQPENLVERDETFQVLLSNPQFGGTTDPSLVDILDGIGDGTILNDDTALVSIDDVTDFEDTGDFTFLVSLSNPISEDVTVQIDTLGITAASGLDFTPIFSQVLTFTAGGPLTLPVTVTVQPENLVELDETFQVLLSHPEFGGTTDSSLVDILDGIGDGTILNDDTATFTIDDVSVNEADGTATFTVHLDNPLDIDVDLDVSFLDISTSAGDFDHATQTVSYLAGDSGDRMVMVAITSDNIVELTESFTASLAINPGTPVGGHSVEVSDTGTGTIFDDDTALVTLAGVMQFEGDAGTTNFVLTITLSNQVDADVTLNAQTVAGGTADPATDFTPLASTLVTFPANSPAGSMQTVTVQVSGDETVELDETFLLQLDSLSASGRDVQFAGGDSNLTATGTILNDDAALVTVTDVMQVEGNAGTTNFVFTITLSNEVDAEVTLNAQTVAGGTADPATDFTPLAGTLVTFPANSPAGSTQTVTVQVAGDLDVEPDETFFLQLDTLTSSGRDVQFTGGGSSLTATGTILNDDVQIDVAPSTESAMEGDSGMTAITFHYQRTGLLTGTSTVDFEVVGSGLNPASADDFFGGTFPTGQITFNPGETDQSITIFVSGDQLVELDETFSVVLSNPENLKILPDAATRTGTIINDDTADLVISDVSQREGLAGDKSFEFFITLSHPVDVDVMFDVMTMNGTAQAGSDYSAVGLQTLTFPAGETITSFVVQVHGDTVLEPNEFFLVLLSNLQAAGRDVVLADNEGQGNIQNDENIQVFGAGSGLGIESMPPQVIVKQAQTGEVLFDFLAYSADFRGGVRVAAADVNGDGAPDIITAAGPGGGPHVKVFDGLSGQTLFSFFAYDPSFQGGVFVAAGDVNGNGFADIITGAGKDGGPHVKVFDGQTLEVLQSFFAFEEGFAGGVSVAAGDVNADGFSDLITGAGSSGGPRVRVIDGFSSQPLADFYAYNPSFAGGVTVAAGDVSGDGFADVITGAGAGGGPHVRIFDGQNLSQVQSEFFAFGTDVTGGIFVAATDTNGDGLAEILVGTGPGPERPGEVRVLSPVGDIVQPSTIIFNVHFRSGIHVAGSLTPPASQAIPVSPPPSSAQATVGGFSFEPSQLPDELLAFLIDDTLFDALLDLEAQDSQA